MLLLLIAIAWIAIAAFAVILCCMAARSDASASAAAAASAPVPRYTARRIGGSLSSHRIAPVRTGAANSASRVRVSRGRGERCAAGS